TEACVELAIRARSAVELEVHAVHCAVDSETFGRWRAKRQEPEGVTCGEQHQNGGSDAVQQCCSQRSSPLGSRRWRARGALNAPSATGMKIAAWQARHESCAGGSRHEAKRTYGQIHRKR